jgi:hypothetical protein
MDHASRGTICFVKTPNDMQMYVQVRSTESLPDWQHVGFVPLDVTQEKIDILLGENPLYNNFA